MADVVSVAGAAEELGVHSSRIRALIASGSLAAEKLGGVWLVDRSSVAARKRQHASAGRPLSPANAWVLMLLASGDEAPPGLGSSARWRVRHALSAYGLDGLRSRLGRRAGSAEYWALPGELRVLRERREVVLSGASAAAAYDLGLIGSDAIDAYAPSGLIASLEREHGLQRISAPESNLILRAVPDNAWLLAGRRFAPLAAVAVDLCSYAEPRARRAGTRLLARIDADLGGS